jgi:hypothetical protein
MSRTTSITSVTADRADYTGSWSSRLRDCGSTNHIHPEGWISSCYYVALPPAVEDTKGAGLDKFGEPAWTSPLKDRRRAFSRVGRLVLFPSYMWHGTIPFHDAHPRTTIAFDAQGLSAAAGVNRFRRGRRVFGRGLGRRHGQLPISRTALAPGLAGPGTPSMVS